MNEAARIKAPHGKERGQDPGKGVSRRSMGQHRAAEGLRLLGDLCWTQDNNAVERAVRGVPEQLACISIAQRAWLEVTQ